MTNQIQFLGVTVVPSIKLKTILQTLMVNRALLSKRKAKAIQKISRIFHNQKCSMTKILATKMTKNLPQIALKT